MVEYRTPSDLILSLELIGSRLIAFISRALIMRAYLVHSNLNVIICCHDNRIVLNTLVYTLYTCNLTCETKLLSCLIRLFVMRLWVVG